MGLIPGSLCSLAMQFPEPDWCPCRDISGENIPQCFNNMFWLKRACDLQVMFLSCNQQVTRLSDEVIEKTWGAYQPGGSRHKQQKHGLLEWPALLHRLDVIDASYRE